MGNPPHQALLNVAISTQGNKCRDENGLVGGVCVNKINMIDFRKGRFTQVTVYGLGVKIMTERVG